MWRSRKSKLSSPVPGSLRAGTSAICMWPMRQQPLDGNRQIAFHDLHVIEVVLQESVALADRVQHVDRLLRAVEDEARHGAGADRLEHQLQAGLAELARRVAQVADQRIDVLLVGGGDP